MSRMTADLSNQSTELIDYNLFSSHSALVDALAREGAAQEHGALVALGGRLGCAATFSLGDVANRYRAALLAELGEADDGELRARDLTQRIALAAQAALLLAHGPAASCEAFLASRLAAGAPAAFGTLPRGSDCDALTARVLEP
jgi:putative acyl-CoA dehydrogenase